MNKQIVVIYESTTGFTKQYANWIAEELECEALELRGVSAQKLSEYETVIFGGWFHAGGVKGLKKAKELFGESTAEKLIVFATGGTLNAAEELIEGAWKNNFTQEEMEQIPHFYMQGGLRYEKMAFSDKLLMKMFAKMMKNKKDKSEAEEGMAQALGSSYDNSSREYIEPLIKYIASGTR